LDGLLEGVTSTGVYRLYGLDIDVGDYQVVLSENESVSGLTLFVTSKHGITDDVGRLLVEVIEGLGGDGTTNARSDGLAGISYKIGNGEDLGRLGLINFEIPIVGELQGKTSVVGSLYYDDVGHKVRTEEKSEGLNNVRLLWHVTGEGVYGELLVRSKHDEIRTEDYSGGLALVIVNLNGGVVRSTVGDDASGITSGRRRGSSTISGDFLGQKGLDYGWAILLPEFFVRRQHVRLSGYGSYTTGLDITNVDTFVFVQRNGTTLLQNVDLDFWDVIGRTEDHPTISRLPYFLTFILEGFASAQ